MKPRIYFPFLWLLAMVLLTFPALSQESPLKVSLSTNAPLVFTDDDGEPAGIYVDVIRFIAGQEGWDLEFVPCAWQQCQQYLEDGTIDLLMSVAYNKERAERFDFTLEPVFNNWAYVYRRLEADIESIVDLEGRKVAVVRANIHTKAFLEVLQSFDVHSEIVEVDDYPDVFRLIAEGRVDAGVVNRLNGIEYERHHEVERTPIIFNPIELFFATPKGKHANIRAAIDRHMGELKQDGDSLYYRSLESWIGFSSYTAVLPVWLRWSAGSVLGVVLILGGFIIVLRYQVKQRTADLHNARDRSEQTVQERTTDLAESLEQLKSGIKARKQAGRALRESEEMFRSAFDDSAVGMTLVDKDGHYRRVNRAMSEFVGYSEEEIRSVSVSDLTHPGDRARRGELARKLWAGEINGFSVEKRYIHRDGHTVWGDATVSAIHNASGEIISTLGQIQDITDRKRVEEDLKSALVEKEVLLKEVQHRVKNNLQLISSFLDLRFVRLVSPEDREIFKQCQDQIRSMALVHNSLYASRDFLHAKTDEYLRTIVTNLVNVYSNQGTSVDTHLTIDDVVLDINMATNIGLIVNEIVTNAMKYAFQGRNKGSITISLKGSSDGIDLMIRDDGIGLPDGIDLETTTGLGLKLVAMLAKQLRANVRIVREEGAAFEIKIPVDTGDEATTR